jgi:hypothetical protein
LACKVGSFIYICEVTIFIAINKQASSARLLVHLRNAATARPY